MENGTDLGRIKTSYFFQGLLDPTPWIFMMLPSLRKRLNRDSVCLGSRSFLVMPDLFNKCSKDIPLSARSRIDKALMAILSQVQNTKSSLLYNIFGSSTREEVSKTRAKKHLKCTITYVMLMFGKRVSD